jgi:tRNA 2-(methylsulfanyl)-N6-isopentenyladenosine37 hydroxylase
MALTPSFQLKTATAPEWCAIALADFDSFLLDHASCERKASAVGLSFVVRYPDRRLLIEPMIQFAREELEHFHQVYRIVESRGLELTEDAKDVYVGQLMTQVRTGRDERFLDRLLVSGVIEARGHERLSMVAAQIEDPKLRQFYERLSRAEAAHQNLFYELARIYFSADVVDSRLDTILDWEATSINSVPHRSALH